MRIEELVHEYGAYIYNYALKLSCHPTDAEDIAQETFIQAWKKLESLQSEEAVKKWLKSICYHQFLMRIRKMGRHLEELVDEYELLEQEASLSKEIFPSPELEVVVAEEVRELQNGCFLAMVRKLTLNQRITFSLVDMYGMKIDDVAAILDTSVSAAKGLLYRARMNLDSFFSDHCEFIRKDNPCSCKAWIDFFQNRDKLQQQTKKLTEAIDYREKNYLYNGEVRNRVRYLYLNMPDKKPGDDWYKRVIMALENK